MNVVVAAAVAEEEVVVDVRIRDLVPAHANLAVLYDGVRFLKVFFEIFKNFIFVKFPVWTHSAEKRNT